MAKTIGVILSERISAGLVVDHKLVGSVRRFPDDHDDEDALVEMHTDALVETISKEVLLAADGAKDIAAVGVALPGLVKNGVVEEAPNLPQLKGARIQELLAAQLRSAACSASHETISLFLIDSARREPKTGRSCATRRLSS